MAENIVVNGQTYEDVDSFNAVNEVGEPVMFYPDAVRYNAQELTAEQQAQARSNLGITGTGADGKDGEKGDPGVYVGTEEPTDESVMVWIDPDGGVNSENDSDLPSYYDTYLPDKIAQVKSLMDETGADGTAFIVFSDSHMELAGSGVNGGNSGKLAHKIMDECQIPFALYFGDAGSNSPQETEELCTESLEAFNTMVKPLEGRLFQILGNHDGAWGLPADIDGDGTVDSSTESYPYNMTREKTFHRALQKNRLNPRAVMSANGAYYYIDDSGSRTRFLMLNTNDKPYLTNDNGTMKTEGNTMKGTMMRQAQIDWIVASLESVPEGWDVIACTHHPLHQNTVTVGQYVRGIFKAFRDKSTYSATYAGEYSEGGGVAYTNQLAISIDSDKTTYGEDYNGDGIKDGYRKDYRLNSSAAVVTGTGWYVTGFMPCKAGDVIRLQDAGLDPANGYMFFYDSTFTKTGGGGSTSALGEGGAQHDSYKVSLDANGHVAQFTVPANSSIAYFRYSTQTAFTDASIVAVNEEIVDIPSTSIDALDISVDFSTNKGGDFIALFDGHAHNDYHYTAASFLVDMIAIACDGRISNCTYMTDETYEKRALGTVYEQCLDVVVVNKAARTIQTVRIGAGENREINY